MKKRALILFEAFIYYAIYLFSGIIGNIAAVAVATVIIGFEYVSNHMLADNAMFFEEVIGLVRSEVALGILLANLSVIIIYFFAFRNRRISLGTYIGVRRFNFLSILSAVIAGIIMHGLVVNILGILKPTVELVQKYESEMQWVRDSNIWLLLSVVLISAPIVEEIVFRGVLVSALQKVITPLGALVVTSVLFGCSHGNMVQAVYSLVLGLVLAFVRIRSGSIWNCVFMHMAFNASNIFTISSKSYLYDKNLWVLSAAMLVCIMLASKPIKK